MIDNSNQPSMTNIQFTWQAIFWRLLFTLLLLLALAVTAKPDTPVLPTAPPQAIEAGK